MCMLQNQLFYQNGLNPHLPYFFMLGTCGRCTKSCMGSVLSTI